MVKKYRKKPETKVFLGGTCNESNWRDELIPLLQVSYFNPVVDDWTPRAQKEEEKQKENCAVHLYVITKEMTGVFSIAEAIDSVNNRVWTILQIFPEGFTEGQLRSLKAVVNLVKKRHGIAYVDSSLQRTARILNYCFSALQEDT